MNSVIYLDYNATSPLKNVIREMMQVGQNFLINPSFSYYNG